MTVATSTRKQTFAGGQDDLTFSFRTLANYPEYIKAVKTLISTGVDTDLIYGSDYTVSVESDGVGGTVTMTPSVSTLYTVTVYRETSDIQESDYNDYNSFPAETVETDFDRRTLKSQETDENIDRTLKFGITSTVTASAISVPDPEAGTILGWNSDADDLENIDPATLDFISVSTDTSLGTSDVIVPTQNAVKTYADASHYQIPISYLSTDGTLADNSDALVSSQKAIKTYVGATAIATSYLSTDGTLADNSDTKIASQKAVKTYVDATSATILGYAYTHCTTNITGSTTFVMDNSKPQITEGNAGFSLPYTPVSTNSVLKIEASGMVNNGTAGATNAIMIFKDGAADSIGARASCQGEGGILPCSISFPIWLSNTTNGTITISLRFGSSSSGSTYLNGISGTGAVFNGASVSSLAVTEYAV